MGAGLVPAAPFPIQIPAYSSGRWDHQGNDPVYRGSLSTLSSKIIKYFFKKKSVVYFVLWMNLFTCACFCFTVHFYLENTGPEAKQIFQMLTHFITKCQTAPWLISPPVSSKINKNHISIEKSNSPRTDTGRPIMIFFSQKFGFYQRTKAVSCCLGFTNSSLSFFQVSASYPSATWQHFACWLSFQVKTGSHEDTAASAANPPTTEDSFLFLVTIHLIQDAAEMRHTCFSLCQTQMPGVHGLELGLHKS